MRTAYANPRAIDLGRVATSDAVQSWALDGGRERAWQVLRAVKAHEAGDGVTLHPGGLLTSLHRIDGRAVFVCTHPGDATRDAVTSVELTPAARASA